MTESKQTDWTVLAPVGGVVVELADGILSITIDRPDSLNAVNTEVLSQMAVALEGSAGDPRVRVVSLRANGRAFCSTEARAVAELSK